MEENKIIKAFKTYRASNRRKITIQRISLHSRITRITLQLRIMILEIIVMIKIICDIWEQLISNFLLPLLSLNQKVCFTHAHPRPSTWRNFCARLAAILLIVTVFHSLITTIITSFNYSKYFTPFRGLIYYYICTFICLLSSILLTCIYLFIYFFEGRKLENCNRLLRFPL